MDVMIAIDKSYIESRIAELDEEISYFLSKPKSDDKGINLHRLGQKKFLLEDILSQGIEIPIEESWSQAVAGLHIDDFVKNYPNGVIIKPKT